MLFYVFSLQVHLTSFFLNPLFPSSHTKKWHASPTVTKKRSMRVVPPVSLCDHYQRAGRAIPSKSIVFTQQASSKSLSLTAKTTKNPTSQCATQDPEVSVGFPRELKGRTSIKDDQGLGHDDL